MMRIWSPKRREIGMRAFGARGYVTPQQLKKTERFLAASRRQKEREKIAALSDQDIVTIMARVITTRAAATAAAGGQVARIDFHQAGIPDHRIDKNFDAAMRLARRQDPKLDGMVKQP